MDYKKFILEGKSVREFKNKEIGKDKLSKIETYISESKRLVEDIAIDIRYFIKDEAYRQLDKIAGYNGHMIEAPNYLVILSDNKKGYVENSGYIGERLILKARELDIDSCWVTFDNSDVIKTKLNIDSSKEVTGIIALGYEKNVNKKQNNSSSHRLGIEEIVYIKEWGKNATVEELEKWGLLDAFSFARMAPSTLNRQPWRFIIDEDKVILAVRKDEFTNNYEERIDTGIAMLYFGLIIDTTMFNCRWVLEDTQSDYNVPRDYKIAGYCNI